MKFGQQLEERSVPQWRHNNIDYAQLKQAIKRATTPTGSDIQDKNNLKKLTTLFEEQFNAVNLFTTLKVKEYSSRILGIESLIINYTQEQLHESGTVTVRDGEVNIGPRASPRSLRAVRNSTNKCSRELKLFSRYLILQQVATRKLFKKFVKYYQNGPDAAQKYIAKLKESEALKSGYDGVSYMNLDLDPYLLEVSLIFDVLHDLEAKTAMTELSGVDSIQSSLVTSKRSSKQLVSQLGSTITSKSSAAFDTYGKGKPRLIRSRLEFDKLFLSECEPIQRFLLASENTEEFKFVLLSLKYQVFDDQIISVSRDIIDTTEQIRRMSSRPSIRSMQSFSSLTNLKPFQPFVDVPTPTSPRVDNSGGGNNNNNASRSPSFSTQSFDVNAKCRSNSNVGTNFISASSNLSMDLLIPMLHRQSRAKSNKAKSSDNSNSNGNTNTNSDLLKGLLSNETYNQHPNIVLRDNQESGCVVMCHVGGLRDHAATETLPLGFINYTISKNSSDDETTFGKVNVGRSKFSEFSKFPLTPINKLIIEWIQLNRLVVVEPKVTFRRTRFVSYNNGNTDLRKKGDPRDGNVYTYMVTLDENICVVVNGDDGERTLQLPHSIFEIKRLKSAAGNVGDNGFDMEIPNGDQTTGRRDGKLVCSQLSKLCNSLVESKIQCYPLLESSTFWSITSRLFSSLTEETTSRETVDCVTRDEIQRKLYSMILGDEYIIDNLPEESISRIKFFEIGQEKTLSLCSTSFRKKHREMAYDYREVEDEEGEREDFEEPYKNRKANGRTEPQDGLIGKQPQNKRLEPDNSKRTERIRYWNEFDDEEAQFNEENFYVVNSDDQGSSDGTMYNDNGFIKLDRHFVDWMFDMCQSFKHTFRIPASLYHAGMSPQQQSQALLLAHLRGPSYGSTTPEEQDASDNRRLQELQEQEMNEAASIFEYRHDEIISFLYFFAVIVACMSSAVSLVIVLRLFRNDSGNWSVDHLWLLISIIVMSLSISLLLACGALLLLFSRFSLAPWWHYIVCFLVFLLVTCSVCYGVVEIFV